MMVILLEISQILRFLHFVLNKWIILAKVRKICKYAFHGNVL